MFYVWLVLKYLKLGRKAVNWTSFLALIGMIIGVGALVLTMSVVSGVESHLKKSIIDVTGHILLMRPNNGVEPVEELEPKIRKAVPELQALTPFVHVEGVLANKGKISGVVIEGVDPGSVNKVLNIKSRIISGEYDLKPIKEKKLHKALIGKELAKKMKLKLGDVFKIVVPRPSVDNSSSFSPRVRKFLLAGVLDLGKYEFNDRTVITTYRAAQAVAGIGNRFSGIRLLLSDPQIARDASFRLSSHLKYPYWTKDWMEFNENFFKAIELEKIVIFVVVMFMVLVASFNISSSLFVNVLRRFMDICILRTMGASRFFVLRIFVTQGLLIGVVGSILGLIVGVGGAEILSRTNIVDIPGEIYHFDRLPVEYRVLDLTAILVVSLLICFVSTLGPALRGAKMDPVEGLRYE